MLNKKRGCITVIKYWDLKIMLLLSSVLKI